MKQVNNHFFPINKERRVFKILSLIFIHLSFMLRLLYREELMNSVLTRVDILVNVVSFFRMILISYGVINVVEIIFVIIVG